MVKSYKLSGFSLLEVLICFFLLQLFWVFAIPPLQGYWQDYQCLRSLHSVKVLLQGKRFKALLQHKNIKLYLPLSLNHELRLSAAFRLSWHGFNRTGAIVFEPDLWLNHANGYFTLQCSSQRLYRLWLNRLGHIRIEPLPHGIP